MAQVNAAAQLAFRAEPAKRAQYVYDPTSDTDDVKEFTDTLQRAETRPIGTVEDTYRPTRQITLRNGGTVPIIFWLGREGEGQPSGTPVNLGGGAAVRRTMQELNPDPNATTIHARNTSANEEASYEVEVDLED